MVVPRRLSALSNLPHSSRPMKSLVFPEASPSPYNLPPSQVQHRHCLQPLVTNHRLPCDSSYISTYSSSFLSETCLQVAQVESRSEVPEPIITIIWQSLFKCRDFRGPIPRGQVIFKSFPSVSDQQGFGISGSDGTRDFSFIQTRVPAPFPECSSSFSN